MCSFKTVKGGSRKLHSSRGWYEYDWTCPNYNWSAEIGGIDGDDITDYNTPTTAGGNSWTMLCDADGTTTNGTTAEGTNCLYDGEEPRMYSMADVMLAADQTRDGGKLYGPAGLYHHRYCGQGEQPDADPNGCPVLRHSPTHQTRVISMTRGIKFVGAGADWDGPHAEGRENFYFIQDGGSDTNGSGTITDADVTDAPGVLDPGGASGFNGQHFPITSGRSGLSNRAEVCARPLNSTGCVTSDAAVLQYALEPLSPIGRAGSLILEGFDAINNAKVEICIDDRITTSGVVDEDPRILCTLANPDATRPTSTTGGPVMAGVSGAAECIGAYSAMKAIAEALPYDEQAYLSIDVRTQESYAVLPTHTDVIHTVLARVAEFTDTSCDSGNGQKIRIAGTDASDFLDIFWPIHMTEYELGGEQTGGVTFTTASKLHLDGGGYTDITVMPGVWEGRDSPTADADCLTTLAGANEENCDDVELIATGGGIKGGVYDSAFFYGGGAGGFAFSAIDGPPVGYGNEFMRNRVCKAHGLVSDASGWILENNVWCDSLSAGQAVVAAGFAPGFQMTGDEFRNNAAGQGITFQYTPNAVVHNIRMIGNQFGGAAIRLRGARHVMIDGVRGYGNKGTPIQIRPTNARDIWDVTVQNTSWVAHSTFVGPSIPQAMILIADSATGDPIAVNTATDEAVASGSLRFINNNLTTHGDDPEGSTCAIFFEGGTGDDSDITNGLGRTVDDYRHLLHFDGISIEAVSDGSPSGTMQAICLGNNRNDENNPGTDSLDGAGAMVGGMPSWRDIYINSVLHPNNLYASQLAASVPGCDTLPHGTIVRIHDDTTAIGSCDHTGGVLDGTGAFTSLCVCDTAADTWAPLD